MRQHPDRLTAFPYLLMGISHCLQMSDRGGHSAPITTLYFQQIVPFMSILDFITPSVVSIQNAP